MECSLEDVVIVDLEVATVVVMIPTCWVAFVVRLC